MAAWRWGELLIMQEHEDAVTFAHHIVTEGERRGDEAADRSPHGETGDDEGRRGQELLRITHYLYSSMRDLQRLSILSPCTERYSRWRRSFFGQPSADR